MQVKFRSTMKNVLEIIEKKPIQVIIGLLVFHVITSFIVSWIAYSHYFISFHNGNGLWNFSRDSTLYHLEAIELVDSIRVGNWGEWWYLHSMHAHVKWLALIYWVFDEANPLLFEFINSVVWVASVVSLYLSARILFNSKTVVVGWASSFLFFPTVLLSSTQLLRDPFYILGFSVVTLGWVMIYRDEFKWKGAFAIIAGYYFIVSIRPYIVPLLLPVFFVCTIIFLFRKRSLLLPTIAMLIGIFSISMFVSMSNPVENHFVVTKRDRNSFVKMEENILMALEITAGSEDEILERQREIARKIKLKKEELLEKNMKYEDGGIINYLNKEIAIRFSLMRYGFKLTNRRAGSSVDENIMFQDYKDLFLYLPRAAQIGFFSPFPNLWISPGVETGYLGRILAGLETLIFYLIFVGFFTVLTLENKILKPVAPVLIIAAIIIVLLGFVVSNVGAIYRMRQGLFIPYFLIGIYGLDMLFIRVRKFLSRHEFRNPV
jgi:hypothetical protein